jgi:hypothetical protein
MNRRCAVCGAALSLMARECPACGSPNPGRRAVLAAAATVAVLGPAIAVAIYAATRWDQPLVTGDRPVDQALPSQPPAGPDDDFAWLSAAMKACDDKAAAEPNALHFLVVPLASDPKDIDRWRQAALNRIGNALVLPGTDTVSGLRDKTLTIAPQEYIFSIRDQNTQAVRAWDAATGVKWLSIGEAGELTSLQMQYKPRDKGRDVWGNLIAHQKGTCYWVNALFEE